MCRKTTNTSRVHLVTEMPSSTASVDHTVAAKSTYSARCRRLPPTRLYQSILALKSRPYNSNNSNKSVQSNLERGPRRGAVAHVRHICPFGQWRAQIRPQKYPSPWTDPQTPPSASSLDPSDLRCQTASGSDTPFFHSALGRPTDRPTHVRTYVRTDRPTDRPRESLTTIGRCVPRATRSNNTAPMAKRESRGAENCTFRMRPCHCQFSYFSVITNSSVCTLQ